MFTVNSCARLWICCSDSRDDRWTSSADSQVVQNKFGFLHLALWLFCLFAAITAAPKSLFTNFCRSCKFDRL